MVAATFQIETDGLSFTISGELGPEGGLPRKLEATGQTVHGAVHALAGKLEKLTERRPLAEDVLGQVRTLVESPKGRNGYDTVKDIKTILENAVLEGGAV